MKSWSKIMTWFLISFIPLYTIWYCYEFSEDDFSKGKNRVGLFEYTIAGGNEGGGESIVLQKTMWPAETVIMDLFGVWEVRTWQGNEQVQLAPHLRDQMVDLLVEASRKDHIRFPFQNRCVYVLTERGLQRIGKEETCYINNIAVGMELYIPGRKYEVHVFLSKEGRVIKTLAQYNEAEERGTIAALNILHAENRLIPLLDQAHLSDLILNIEWGERLGVDVGGRVSSTLQTCDSCDLVLMRIRAKTPVDLTYNLLGRLTSK